MKELFLIGILIITLIVLVLNFYFAFRNDKVLALRTELIDKGYFHLHSKYSYNQMLYTFRPLKSFRKELFTEGLKIKQGSKGK